MWILWIIAIVLVIYLAIFIVPLITAYAAMWGETYRVSVPEFSDRDAIPAETLERLQPWIDDLVDRGFEIVRYQVFRDNLVGKPRYAPYWGVIFQHQSPPIFAAVTDLPQSPDRSIVCSFSSYSQERRSMTINLSQDRAGDKPEDIDRICYLDSASVAELWPAHQQLIGSLGLDRLSVDEWLAIVDRQNAAGIELMVRAGKITWIDRQRQIYRYDRGFVFKSFWRSLADLWKQIRKSQYKN